jgi:flagellar motor protein MotB
MAAKCKKCDPHELCEECPEWIFTLADLIMCMMGLFVLLWVLKESGAKASSPAVAKQMEEQFLKGVSDGFKGYIPTDLDERNPLRKLNGPGAQGATNESPTSPDGTENQSSIIRPGRQVTIGGKLVFAKGAPDLDAGLKAKLDRVAELIRGHRLIVQVKGHTSRDDLPADATTAAKMDLSLRRAQATADYLTSKGVEPEVLRVQGCSTFEPVRQGDSSVSGQSLNRRVEVFVSDTPVDQFQDRASVSVQAKPTTETTKEPSHGSKSESHEPAASGSPAHAAEHGH